MTDLNILNEKFEAVEKLTTQVDLTPEVINVPVVHQVVKATLAGRRQGNAATKNRAAVRGGGAKPFKQKGTGRARQGSIRSPLMVGGGTAFGPSPRSYEQKLNKKLVLNAVQSILADKFQSGKLTIVESLPTDGKTKVIHSLLSEKGLLPALVVTESSDSLALRAARNLQYGKALPVKGFSVYEAVKFENLVIEKAALEQLLNRVEKNK
ncbi:MAG: 50S ribosomal protein L4 [Bdellovibrionales bacterium]|nr:50S ribosomal protein L4 [Bdellovibrionales bacterium]